MIPHEEEKKDIIKGIIIIGAKTPHRTGCVLTITRKTKNKLYFPSKNERDACIQTWLGKAQMEVVQRI